MEKRGLADAYENVRAFFESLRSPAVVSVYLFGSHAEGRVHEESDLDVAVLFDRTLRVSRRDRILSALSLNAALQAELGVATIDLVVLQDAPPGFARSIVLDGQRVYCRNPEVDLAFKRDVQLRAADLIPFLRRTRSIKLDALERP